MIIKRILVILKFDVYDFIVCRSPNTHSLIAVYSIYTVCTVRKIILFSHPLGVGNGGW